MFVKRVASEPHELNEIQLKWIESKGNPSTYLARRDLHACVCLMIEEHAAALLWDPVQRTVPIRREIVDDMVTKAECATAPSQIRRGFLGMLFKPFSLMGTFVKFMFLAFIAEPEFQRELAYCVGKSIFRIPIMFLATRVWIYARIIQNILVPFFFVLLPQKSADVVL